LKKGPTGKIYLIGGYFVWREGGLCPFPDFFAFGLMIGEKLFETRQELNLPGFTTLRIRITPMGQC